MSIWKIEYERKGEKKSLKKKKKRKRKDFSKDFFQVIGLKKEKKINFFHVFGFIKKILIENKSKFSEVNRKFFSWHGQGKPILYKT